MFSVKIHSAELESMWPSLNTISQLTVVKIHFEISYEIPLLIQNFGLHLALNPAKALAQACK